MASASSPIGTPKKRAAPGGVKLTWTHSAVPGESMITGPAKRPAAKLAMASPRCGVRPSAMEKGAPKLMTSGTVSDATSTRPAIGAPVSR